MYCSNCGKEIADEAAAFCPYCGIYVASGVYVQSVPNKRKYNGILWMILNIFVSILGISTNFTPLLVGITGAVFGGKCMKENKKNNYFPASIYGSVSMTMFFVGFAAAFVPISLELIGFIIGLG